MLVLILRSVRLMQISCDELPDVILVKAAKLIFLCLLCSVIPDLVSHLQVEPYCTTNPDCIGKGEVRIQPIRNPNAPRLNETLYETTILDNHNPQIAVIYVGKSRAYQSNDNVNKNREENIEYHYIVLL